MMKKKRLLHVLVAMALALFIGLGLASTGTTGGGGGGGGGSVRCSLDQRCFNQTDNDGSRWCSNGNCAAGRAPPPGRDIVFCNC